MSIQTTRFLTRGEAESKAIDKLLEEKYHKQARHDVVDMTDEELEDYIDEHFYNYSIT